MVESTRGTARFGTSVGLSLAAAFDAGRLTSDSGLPWVSEADQALGLCDLLAGCIPDWRQWTVRHGLPTLVRQRVYQIACGYADQNDATTLRTHPLLKLVCGRRPVSAAARRGTSCSTWTGPTTPRMATRRESLSTKPGAVHPLETSLSIGIRPAKPQH